MACDASNPRSGSSDQKAHKHRLPTSPVQAGNRLFHHLFPPLYFSNTSINKVDNWILPRLKRHNSSWFEVSDWRKHVVISHATLNKTGGFLVYPAAIISGNQQTESWLSWIHHDISSPCLLCESVMCPGDYCGVIHQKRITEYFKFVTNSGFALLFSCNLKHSFSLYKTISSSFLLLFISSPSIHDLFFICFFGFLKKLSSRKPQFRFKQSGTVNSIQTP